MKNPKAIKIQYSEYGNSPRGERLINMPHLQRFNGYDIGARETNHLVFKDPSVCPEHARIIQEPTGEFSLLHLETGRKDSVCVNGHWLPAGESAPLENGSAFSIGAVRLSMEIIYHS